MAPLALPDLDRLRELLERLQEILALGGIALALLGSFVFLLAWVASHLRQPTPVAHPVLSAVALGSAYVPVALTLVAAAGALVPALQPFVLKSFALAIVTGAFAWWLAIATLVVGGTAPNLGRARRALLLAGTPWYCLALYLSTLL